MKENLTKVKNICLKPCFLKECMKLGQISHTNIIIYNLIFQFNIFYNRFSLNKQYVLITARVHPGETPASYALEGIINFLLNKTDPRA